MSDEWAATGPPGLGAGWVGTGAPIQVAKQLSSRGLRDGAGLCSPGRWPKARRRLPDTHGVGRALVEALRSTFTWGELRGDEALKRLTLTLSVGKITSSPFTEQLVKTATGIISDWASRSHPCVRDALGDLTPPLSLGGGNRLSPRVFPVRWYG